ncbi:MAG TPA: hypothetical protein V6C78_18440 [Crinalium sp.]|jgi:hypothetical protein
MATTKRRASTSSAVSKNILEQASLSLGNLPEKPKKDVSLREAIQLMQDDIRSALDKGYDHEEVAELLTEQGVEINGPSLKYYLTKYTINRKRGPKAGKPRGTRTKGESSAEIAASDSTEETAAPKRGRRAATKTKAPGRTAAKTADSVEAPKAPSTRGRRKK